MIVEEEGEERKTKRNKVEKLENIKVTMSQSEFSADRKRLVVRVAQGQSDLSISAEVELMFLQGLLKGLNCWVSWISDGMAFLG